MGASSRDRVIQLGPSPHHDRLPTVPLTSTSLILLSRSETAPSTSSSKILRSVPIYPIPLPASVTPQPASLIEFEVTQPPQEAIWAEIERVLDTVVGIAREVGPEDEDQKMDLDGDAPPLKQREFKTVVLCQSIYLDITSSGRGTVTDTLSACVP